MFIKNFNFNKKLFSKVLLIILFTIIILLVLIGIYSIFSQKKETEDSDKCDTNQDLMIIKDSNYTNILNTVYKNPDNYVGVKIKYSGFVYRLYDFEQNQFVLGRQMIISSDYKAVVVGFLCDLNDAIKYKDWQWVEIEGIIEKGNYHGEIPIIKITKIKEIEKPSDEFVYPPTDDYVPVFKML